LLRVPDIEADRQVSLPFLVCGRAALLRRQFVSVATAARLFIHDSAPKIKYA
jgi:hypothetical protein